MTRAQETLILSGAIDLGKPPRPRPGAAPLTWILPALDGVVEPRVNDPEQLSRPAVPVAPAPAGTALPVPATLAPARPPAAPAAIPTRLSFSSLGDYGRCGYRWYLSRVLGLPRVKPPPLSELPADAPPAPAGLDLMTRGSLVHALLEDLDFDAPRAPDAETVAALAATSDLELTPAEVADVQRLVASFAGSPLCARLAAARVVRREAPFAFGLEPGTRGLLVNGVVDVMATEDDGVLIVDYKTNPLEGTDPETLTAADYAAQRLVYALAALRDGAARVEVAHCYLERPAEPATATYGPADTARLTEELVGLAGGLLEGDFSVTATPHRELCGTCPGRRALCSYTPEQTLRSLAGH
jgi:ATP-dependent exoDNAse (exonuclease V) beta subunit